MVDTDGGLLGGALKLAPRVGALLEVEAPDVVDGLLASVASEDDEERLDMNHGVAVAPARSGSDNGDGDPGAEVVAELEDVEVVVGETPTADSTAKDDHLVELDCQGLVCSPVGGDAAAGFNALPLFEVHIANEDIACDDISAGVANRA